MTMNNIRIIVIRICLYYRLALLRSSSNSFVLEKTLILNIHHTFESNTVYIINEKYLARILPEIQKL